MATMLGVSEMGIRDQHEKYRAVWTLLEKGHDSVAELLNRIVSMYDSEGLLDDTNGKDFIKELSGSSSQFEDLLDMSPVEDILDDLVELVSTYKTEVKNVPEVENLLALIDDPYEMAKPIPHGTDMDEAYVKKWQEILPKVQSARIKAAEKCRSMYSGISNEDLSKFVKTRAYGYHGLRDEITEIKKMVSKAYVDKHLTGIDFDFKRMHSDYIEKRILMRNSYQAMLRVLRSEGDTKEKIEELKKHLTTLQDGMAGCKEILTKIWQGSKQVFIEGAVLGGEEQKAKVKGVLEDLEGAEGKGLEPGV